MNEHESDPHLNMIMTFPMPVIVPEPPAPEYRNDLLNRTTPYLVTNGGIRRAIFLQGYYPTVRHVVAYLVAQFVANAENLGGDEHCDFAVWQDGTLLAAGHWRLDTRGIALPSEQMQTAYFDDDESDDLPLGDPFFGDSDPFELSIPGWPTREQWEEDGSDRIVLRPKGDPAWDRPAIKPGPIYPPSAPDGETTP